MKIRPLPPAENALRRRARRIFHAAQMNGVIQRRRQCERCGYQQPEGKSGRSMFGISAHHDDYSKPLDVQWLCKGCHSAADVALNRRLKALSHWPSQVSA